MPRLVLLDEPFSSLDARLRSELREEVIGVLRQAATTSVLVTHDQDEALSLADEVALLRDGRVAQLASPSELYTNPVDPGTASFVGVANFVSGRIEDGVVVTPFGPLPYRKHAPGETAAGDVVALIRPEDLVLNGHSSGRGVAALVERIEYYGHDALVHLVIQSEFDAVISAVFPNPTGAYGGERRTGGAVVVRIHGALSIHEGDEVRLDAHGPVLVWPATAS
jgi:iron(III) transport system ATP-binding protein